MHFSGIYGRDISLVYSIVHPISNYGGLGLVSTWKRSFQVCEFHYNGNSYTGKTTFLYWDGSWALLQYPTISLIVRSRKVSKQRDFWLELHRRSEIWQAYRQECCRCASQISKRCDNSSYWSRGFETARDLTIRRHTYVCQFRVLSLFR